MYLISLLISFEFTKEINSFIFIKSSFKYFFDILSINTLIKEIVYILTIFPKLYFNLVSI